MALFQPTNIIPSSFTDGVVDAARDIAQVSWQVNGNSPMTRYEIDFYDNDTDSEVVETTGRISADIPSGGFYGTDRFGQPQMFTWTATDKSSTPQTWSAYNSVFTNGKQFKFKITQIFATSDVIYGGRSPSVALTGKMYMTFADPNGKKTYVVFDFGENRYETLAYVYYNYTQQKGWIISPTRLIPIPTTLTDSQPHGDNIFSGDAPATSDGYDFIVQTSFSTFKTRTTPQIIVYLSDSKFEAENDMTDGMPLGSSIAYFNAAYSQEQGDAIRWARWQIATAGSFDDGNYEVGEIIYDTGEVTTASLRFEFNGLLVGQNYAVRCLVESESGQQAINPVSQNDGWIFFTVAASGQSEYKGEFTLQCLPKENAALLQWDSEEVPLVVSGKYTLNDGSVTLESTSAIQWGKAEGFAAPWTVAIELTMKAKESFIQEVKATGEQQTLQYKAKGYIVNNLEYSTPAIRNYPIYAEDDDKRGAALTYPAAMPQVISYLTLYETPFAPTGQLAVISFGDPNAKDIVIRGIRDGNNTFKFRIGDLGAGTSDNSSFIDISLDELKSSTYSNREKITLVITPKQTVVYAGGSPFISESFVKTYEGQKIDNIRITGGTSGATFRCVTVYQGEMSDTVLNELYGNADFKPSWNAENYKLYMTANFNGNIDGGEVSASRIYRQQIGQTALFPIFYSGNSGITQLKDFGIVSRKSYTYWLYEYDKNNAFMKSKQCTYLGSDQAATVFTCFKNFSLLVCDYDSEQDAYHVRKQYLFALNISEGSVGNNNSPTLNANFTPYPTRMPSTQNYASGTLQGLIGVIYTVPALVEEINGYKHTAKPSTMDYFDSVDLEKELYDLSVTPYTLFLRDMKGRVRMVTTNGAISMTTNLKQRQQSVSISLPWVEIGDASDAVIIQTPNDYGWSGDNQNLEVQFAADPQTGVLAASYPKPYEGTKFYLLSESGQTKRG